MTVLLQFGVLVAVATSLGHAAMLGMATSGRYGRTSWLFALAGLASAWEALFAGVHLAGLLEIDPRLAALPVAFSGFAAPLVLLFMRSLVQGPREPLGAAWALLGLGIPGLFLALATVLWPAYGQLWRTALMAPELATSGWQALSLFIATVDGPLLVFTGLASLLTTGRSEDRHIPLRGVLIAAAVVALLPPLLLGTGEALEMAVDVGRVAPAFTLPFSYLAWRMLVGTNQALGALSSERALLRRYLPRSVVDRIGSGSVLSGAEAEVTILFSDIRGFTTLSETLEPEELISLLKEYLGTMADVAQKHHGVVDKFIGDAILVVFGLDSEGEHDAVDAVHCAREMLLKLEAFNRRRPEHAPLRIGIGLHRGRVVHGSVGSEDRMEYTVVGDTVNTASRCEAMTKELGVPILATQQVLDVMPLRERANLSKLGRYDIRGRSSGVTLWSVHPIALPTAAPGASWTAEPAPNREEVTELEEMKLG